MVYLLFSSINSRYYKYRKPVLGDARVVVPAVGQQVRRARCGNRARGKP